MSIWPGRSDAETAALIARLSTLTPQQVRVLMMLSGGLLNKQIAYELGVSEATVKAHVSAILQKLGVESRTQAVIAAGRSKPANGRINRPRQLDPDDLIGKSEVYSRIKSEGMPFRIML